jgi:hypothetical protein
MKTNTIILATLLILQVSSLFAINDGIPMNTNKEMNLSTVLLLAPVTPKEATFEEMSPTAEILFLAPVTPKEASFEDEAEGFSINHLAPVTPAEADFNDDEPALNANTISLAPETPSEADFSDLP